MIKRFTSRKPPPLVAGHDIGPPRLTAAGWLALFRYLAVPAMLLGAVFDFVIQAASGQCVGIWCFFL